MALFFRVFRALRGSSDRLLSPKSVFPVFVPKRIEKTRETQRLSPRFGPKQPTWGLVRTQGLGASGFVIHPSSSHPDQRTIPDHVRPAANHPRRRPPSRRPQAEFFPARRREGPSQVPPTRPASTYSRTAPAASSTSAKPRTSGPASAATSSKPAAEDPPHQPAREGGLRRRLPPTPRARSTPSSWNRGSSKTSSRPTTASCATTRASLICKSPRTRTTPPRRGHPRAAVLGGEALRPVHLRWAACAGRLQVLQRVFRFRTCSLDIETEDERWRWFRPCLLASIKQCTAPCNLSISKDDYRRDIARLRKFLEGNRKSLLKEMQAEMQQAADELRYELGRPAAGRDLHDRIAQGTRRTGEARAARGLLRRPKEGPHRSAEGAPAPPNGRGTIEGMDIAHPRRRGDRRQPGAVHRRHAPSNPATARYRIREVEGIDDFASMQEVVSPPVQQHRRAGPLPPRHPADRRRARGQLNRAVPGPWSPLGIDPPLVLSLAKKEELIYRMHDPGADPASPRSSYALRLLQYVRDEAHRFAASTTTHLLRRKRTLGRDG